jgi:cell division transport system permease protein
MSGSFDRPTGRPTMPHLQARAEPTYDTGRTGQATARSVRPPLEQERAEAGASRGRRASRTPPNTPIVPAGSVTGRSLTVVITIMCFLASLTAGAVYMMNQSASAWLRDIASEVTVQIETKDRAEIDKTVAEVTGFLASQPGIAKVKALSVNDAAQLLEPWLGQTDALTSLPVPRLIAIELDRNSPPNVEALRVEVSERFPGVSVDDHRRWQQQIRTITRSFALGGLAILLLVGAATTSNRDIVEVLHFVGATDRFIAREFERHFLRLGVRAGVVGALWATGVFLAMPTVMEIMGGGAVTLAEIRRLVGIASLDAPGYFLLAIVVLVIAALCMLTSRLGVYRILNSQH